ncbi:hypothetical protein CI102_10719 [Trichoderma harzianum]|nr:hypothetical protein CI102_10719 [Trichoderma harzianum]
MVGCSGSDWRPPANQAPLHFALPHAIQEVLWYSSIASGSSIWAWSRVSSSLLFFRPVHSFASIAIPPGTRRVRYCCSILTQSFVHLGHVLVLSRLNTPPRRLSINLAPPLSNFLNARPTNLDINPSPSLNHAPWPGCLSLHELAIPFASPP